MDKFIIRQIIGEGASSTVYRAFDTTSGRNAAIKVFSAGKRGSERGEEGQILQILGKAPHEHIVRFYGQIGHSAYAFELCECNLISFINEHELDLRGIKKIMRMVLLGLDHIHSQGVIHRDMKLGNILVKGDSIKLCDFGLSCLKAENDYSYCGTRDYLAPEMRMGGGRYDEGIDVYAAGVIYRTLVSREKGGDVGGIEDVEVRGLMMRMMEPDASKRIKAREALEDGSFEELFSRIPRFDELGSMSRTTKYGRIEKGDKGGVSWIGIEYRGEDGERRSIRLERHEGDRQAVDVQIVLKVDGREAEKRRLTNSMLKHFNYLCSYVRMAVESTVRYREIEGRFRFSVRASGTRDLERGGIRLSVRADGTKYFESEKGREPGLEERAELRLVFDEFDRKYLKIGDEMKYFGDERKYLKDGSIAEQQSSMSMTLSREGLMKKYEYVENVGWAIKTGLTFTLLLSSGRRYVVDAEEQTVSDGGMRKMRLDEVPVELLEQVGSFVKRFVS